MKHAWQQELDYLNYRATRRPPCEYQWLIRNESWRIYRQARWHALDVPTAGRLPQPYGSYLTKQPAYATPST